MAPYARVPMPQPQPFNVMGSLADLMQMTAASTNATRQATAEARQEAEYQQKVNDRTSIDTALAPQNAMAIASNSPGWQGPIDPANPPPTPSRDAIITSVPGHLRPVVQKMFDDADEQGRAAQKSMLALKKATQDATDRNDDYLGNLGMSILSMDGHPLAVQAVLEHAKETFKDYPDLVSKADAIGQQIAQDPTQATTIAQTLVAASPKYRDEWAKRSTVVENEMIRVAADPNNPQAPTAQAWLDKSAAFARSKAAPPAPPDASSENAAIQREAARRGVDPNALPESVINQIRATHAAVTREPDKPDEVKIAQRASAERWKATELQQLEEKFRTTKNGGVAIGPNGAVVPVVAMSEDELTHAKNQIQQSYLAQIGEPTPKATALSPQAPPMTDAAAASFYDRQIATRAKTPAPASTPIEPAAARPAPVAPASQGGPTIRIGQRLTLKNGRSGTVTAVSPDGTKFRLDTR